MEQRGRAEERGLLFVERCARLCFEGDTLEGLERETGIEPATFSLGS
jgi:hypothetical protein